MGGVELLGETGDTGGRPSPSQDPVEAALLLAQAFSLGGGAGITFSGSLEEPEEGGIGEAPGEEGSLSLPLNTSFSPERSPSRHREPVEKENKGANVHFCFIYVIAFYRSTCFWIKARIVLRVGYLCILCVAHLLLKYFLAERTHFRCEIAEYESPHASPGP